LSIDFGFAATIRESLAREYLSDINARFAGAANKKLTSIAEGEVLDKAFEAGEGEEEEQEEEVEK
jgi:hypothetical protein